MTKKHLKALTMPKSWPVKRKGRKFVLRPTPGKQFSMSIPLSLIFKDMLKYCKTSNEVKTILRDKEVLVDGVRRKDPKYLVGFMDIMSIPITNENYRMILDENKKLSLFPIDEKEASVKVCKIIGKTVLKHNKLQLNLSDSRNVIAKEGSYSVGDSVLLKLPGSEIKDSFKAEKGNFVVLTEGGHAGNSGVIEHISKDLIKIKSKDAEFETTKRSVYVVGKGKSSVKID
jgi:small subunit ribosomal protein S4e